MTVVANQLWAHRAADASTAGSAVPTTREAAVHEVYVAHYGQLAGWCTRLIGDPDLGHDVATEAFLRLLDHWGRVDEPKAWLFTTSANIIRDHWRKRGRENIAYRKVGEAPLGVDGPDSATNLTVRTAVQSLPDRLRVAVMLHYFADLTIAQVATAIGKSEGAIKRDLWDARGRLAKILGDAR